MQSKILSGVIWKLLERLGVQGSQFVIQIVLARLLAPEDYGMLSLMVIFTNLANIFVHSGLNTALIQNKDVTEDDYSSVFWVSFSISIGLYAVLFLSAPWIANFYNMPEIISPFRVISLMLIPGAFNSVQLAKISREMEFKFLFKSNIASAVIAGVLGIIFAYCGAGVWALVVQAVTQVVVACIVMWFTVNWRPQIKCNFCRIKMLFSFGWKLLVSALLETLYADLRSLVIGKKYDGGILGYYNRGKQFPQIIINTINGTVQSVMLPAMSRQQDRKSNLKSLMRTSLSMTAYIIFPMMAGLAAVAEPLVELLLTDKWLPCVPYMQIYCITFAFYPVHSCNLQAINALGRSDIFLKLEIIKKIYGVIILAIAVFCFGSPLAIAASGLVATGIGWFVNAFPNKKLLGYSYLEQIKDVLSPMLMTIVMFVVVLLLGRLHLDLLILLVLQIIVGIVVYLLLSVIVKPEPFKLIISQIKNILDERKV